MVHWPASARRWPRRARLRRACVSAHVDPAGRAEHSRDGRVSAANLDWAPERVCGQRVSARPCGSAGRQRAPHPAGFVPALLSELFLTSRRSVVVAGTHGKTTTSSLMSFVLAQAGRDPSFLIGGVPVNFRQSWHLGSGPEFVVEGTNTTRVFRQEVEVPALRPQVVILTSVNSTTLTFSPRGGGQGCLSRIHRAHSAEGHLVVCAASPGAMEVARARAAELPATVAWLRR